MRQCADAFSGEKPRILQRRDLSPIRGLLQETVLAGSGH
jgi:hypothetical protein